MEEGKRLRRMLAGLTALLCLAVGLCGALHLREAELRREIAMRQQREMADVIAAMADIEVNLSKLLVASGARQSVSLLGETAILAQHVESGLSRLTAGERAFERCDFRNIRGKAVSLVDCLACRVTTCDIQETGTGGIFVSGGNRRSLMPGENVVEDTRIRNFSVHCLTYASAVHMMGVSNVVRHCELSGAPHMAVGVYGNDHVFEYNVVSNVCMSSDDAAAFYKGRNPSCRGNVLRYNFWSEIGSPRGHGNAAVYFDDGDGGDLVYGNVFYRCGEPGFGGFGTVFSHGGHSNLVQNCVFV